MRRFAPALGGHLSRRRIVLSPHLWTATGVMFAIYAVSNVVIALIVPGLVRNHLLVLAAGLGAVAVGVILSRPPQPDSAGSHVVPMAAYLGAAASVWAYAPYGSATIISGLFTGPLLALWLRDRKVIAGHMALASCAMLAAAVLGGGDVGTVFAALCFVPASWALAVFSVLLLEGVEAQGQAYEQLAMRDPLTEIGNEGFLTDVLKVELKRHRSSGRTLTIVELKIANLAAINTADGRVAGDQVLHRLAALLRETSPPSAGIARTAGDRFTVVLPNTGPKGAQAFLGRARSQVAAIDVGAIRPVALAGLATFPSDAAGATALRQVSAERLAIDARRPRPQLVPRPTSAAPIERPRAAVDSPSTDSGLDLWNVVPRITRRRLARHPIIGRLPGATILFYVSLAVAAQLLYPAVSTSATVAVTALAAIAGVAMIALGPPALGTPANHAFVAVGWGLPIAAMAACSPHASWAAGTAVFSGVLIGTRLTKRRDMAVHMLAASGWLLALIASGRIDTVSTIAALSVLLAMWMLVLAYASTYQVAERQARRMSELVLRDPLTGSGNERLLRERLAVELPRHADVQMPLVVVDVALDGLNRLRAKQGRGAVANVLRDVAEILAVAAGPTATVARIEAGNFRMLLPLEAAEEFATRLNGIRYRIAQSSSQRELVLAKIGIAEFPIDGQTDQELTSRARQRRAQDNPRAHRLVPEPDQAKLLSVSEIINSSRAPTGHVSEPASRPRARRAQG